MKTCTTCGNDILNSVSVCPFCDHPQTGDTNKIRRKNQGIPTIDLKRGRPFVEEALQRLDRELQFHRQQGTKLIRVLHGWGSGGVGGKIRIACHQELGIKERRGEIQSFLMGEDYSERTVAGRALLKKFPKLKDTLRTDRENPGITLVEP